ncbi:MAG: spore coat polysaccharide biosynthesis protein [Streptosporangiaceae bacterium]|jgi:spore coat polysaccharide biosynthesis predicted glycosyltransferase SpsG|nr:spore coat polysaccharide biosynthesis protein [Streptosporangiaceae bacterium]
MRCLALAEELLGRGAEVSFLGGLGGLEWIRDQLRARGLPLLPGPLSPEGLITAARRLRLDAMVLDSYELDPHCAGALRQAGMTVLAIVDGDTRGQDADLYLDQNLGAEHSPVNLPAGTVRLAGSGFALLRDSVRALRPAGPRRPGDGVPGVLCFFGGTDTADAAPRVIELAAATGAPFAATVIAARDSTADALAAIALVPGQSVTAVAPTDRLPHLAAAADLVVSAGGTSTWELLCLGVPAALIWVADNQRQGYDALVSRGLAAGLGAVTGLGGDAEATLKGLLTNPAARTDLAARGFTVVDGRGRERVADELLSHLTPRPA